MWNIHYHSTFDNEWLDSTEPDHEARQHSAPDTQPFFDAVRRRAGLKPEIGHASYEGDEQCKQTEQSEQKKSDKTT